MAMASLYKNMREQLATTEMNARLVPLIVHRGTFRNRPTNQTKQNESPQSGRVSDAFGRKRILCGFCCGSRDSSMEEGCRLLDGSLRRFLLPSIGVILYLYTPKQCICDAVNCFSPPHAYGTRPCPLAGPMPIG